MELGLAGSAIHGLWAPTYPPDVHSLAVRGWEVILASKPGAQVSRLREGKTTSETGWEAEQALMEHLQRASPRMGPDDVGAGVRVPGLESQLLYLPAVYPQG